MAVKLPSKKVELMNVEAPLPCLRKGVPADSFRALRAAVIEQAGLDFLAVCSDMMRGKDFKSDKPGVALKSRHQCGDAFDYDIPSTAAFVVREDIGGHTYFRTYLKTKGSLGKLRTLTDYRGKKVKARFVDFTELAGTHGWIRIAAHAGWAKTFSKMEYWHYENTEGLSYDDAMALLYPKK